MGPVFLSIPMDDWTHECAPIAVRKVQASMLADRLALDEVVSALNDSHNPVLVVGSQIEEDGAWHDIVALAERLNADVYQDPIPSRWTFPRNHPRFVGGLLPAQRPLAEQLSPYEVVLVLGAPVFLYYAYVPGSPVAAGTRLFQLTNSPEDAACASDGTSIVGNIREAASYILERTRARAGKRADRAQPLAQASPHYPISPAFLFSTLNRLLPANSVIVEECPSAKGDLDQYLVLNQPRSFYSVRSGILGFGVPAAIGLQLASPKRRVICLVGEGSLQYSIQALWSAVQYEVPALFVVLHNGDYSALKSFADFTQVGRNVPGMELPALDIVKLAEGYAVPAEQVDRPEQLEPLLEEALQADHPRLINVKLAGGPTKCMGMDQSVNPPNYR
jgi:benzoylformate decarboxylase